jgi:hypothetical protein
MTMKPWHRANQDVDGDVAFEFPMDELLPAPAPTITTMQADCCVARAEYLVVLPRTASRPRAAELFLCGHHFRTGKDALRRVNATAFDGTTNKLCAIAG